MGAKFGQEGGHWQQTRKIEVLFFCVWLVCFYSGSLRKLLKCWFRRLYPETPAGLRLAQPWILSKRLPSRTLCVSSHTEIICAHTRYARRQQRWEQIRIHCLIGIISLSLLICGKIKLVLISPWLFVGSQPASLPPLLMIRNRSPPASIWRRLLQPTERRHREQNTERNSEDEDWMKDRCGGKRALETEREKGSDTVREGEGERSWQRDGCRRVVEVRRWCND